MSEGTFDSSTAGNSTAKSSSSNFERDLSKARRILSLNGMYLMEPTSRDKYTQVKRHVDELLIDRDSEKKRNTEHLRLTFEKFGWSNEITLQANVMPLLRGIERSVTEPVPDGKPKTVVRAWLMDHLGENWDFAFVAESLQTLERGTEFEKKIFEAILKKYPKLKNPKPDIVYGPWASAFSEEENSINQKFIEFSSISEDLYHPAFIWEWKSAKGNIDESRLQAVRAAAAVAYSIRKFQSSVGINPDDYLVNGVDLNSLVYAMVIDHSAAYLYAGFYEHHGSSMVFRLLPVRHYAYFLDAKPLSNLRQDVHSVLDWTIGARLTWIKRLINQYVVREKAKLAAAGPSTGGAPSGKGPEASTGPASSPSGSPAPKKQRTATGK